MRSNDSTLRRIALVTGGSSGIGKATVLALARDGCDIGFTYRSNASAAEEVATEVRSLGREVVTKGLNLERLTDAHQAVNELSDSLGGLDVLVNNAAVDHRGLTAADDVSQWSRVLTINFLGAVAMVRAAAPIMSARSNGPTIINVTSVIDSVPVPGGGAYCASKAALWMATQVMALELAEVGIRVNAVAPGHTSTPQNFGPEEIDPRAGVYPEIPLGRPAEADEVAAVIALLASPSASYLTGSRVLVDGGLNLHSGPGALERAVGYTPAYQASEH